MDPGENSPPASDDFDFYGAGSPESRVEADARQEIDTTLGQAIQPAAQETIQQPLMDAADQEDSSSEMDTSSDRSASPGLPPKPEPLSSLPPLPLPRSNAFKRARDELDDTNSASDSLERASQRPKLSSPSEDAENGTSTPMQDSEVAPPQMPTSATIDQDSNPISQPSAAMRPVKTTILLMPAKVWQQLLAQMTPAGMARLMCVDRHSLAMLTGVQKGKDTQNSETMWAAARKKTYPNMPRPLVGMTERQMLQLIGGKDCEECGALPTHPPPSTSISDRGPGHGGIRVIWSFGKRLCGPCLDQLTISDLDLLRSGFGSLRLGLPFIFLTPDLHAHPSNPLPPKGSGATKRYLRSLVEALDRENHHVRDLGEAAHEEWHKGLPQKGANAKADAAKWEAWEHQYPRADQLRHVLRELDAESFPKYFASLQGRSNGMEATQPNGVANGADAPPAQAMHWDPHHGMFMQPPGQQMDQLGYPYYGYASTPMPLPGYPPPYHMHSYPGFGAMPLQHMLPYHYNPQDGTTGQGPQMDHPSHPSQQHAGMPPSHQSQPTPQHGKIARSAEEVKAIRDARKADIERRCLELYPPVHADLLPYMESFNNAMQITRPLSDEEWAVLAPKLEDQRDTAQHQYQRAKDLEQLEYFKQQHAALLTASIPSTAYANLRSKKSKEVDHGYESKQQPLRNRLSQYVDEFLGDNSVWGSRTVDKYSCAEFAASCLSYIYKRYTEEHPDSGEEATQNGRPGTAKEPILSLDNMKWVWENKIRQHVDNFSGQPFTCAECRAEDQHNPNPKSFAFEGLMQHYGACHTDDWKKENVSVHWPTAKWPADPPYSTHFVQERPRSAHRSTPAQFRKSLHKRPGSRGLHDYSSPALQGAQYQTSNGYHDSAAQYLAHGNPSPASTQPYMDISKNAQVELLAEQARAVWDALDGVRELPTTIRIITALFHAKERFAQHFHHTPNLDLFTDALTMSDAIIRPLKNASGLLCLSCVLAQSPSADTQRNLERLITHYKIHHLQHTPRADWTQDMISPPDTQAVAKLTTTPGMDDGKLALIAAAFPYMFQTGVPKIGVVQEVEVAAGGLADRLLNGTAKKPKKSKKQRRQSAHPDQSREQSAPLAAEDEYDPRRPGFLLPSSPHPRAAIAGDAITAPAAITPALALSGSQLSALEALARSLQAGQQEPERPPSVGSRSPPPQQPAPRQSLDLASMLAAVQQPQQPPWGAGPADAAGIAQAQNARAWEQNRAFLPPQGYAPAAATPSPVWAQSSGQYGAGSGEMVVYVDENGRPVFPVRY